jgi:putative oligomerization/nucleic acid binding protein
MGLLRGVARTAVVAGTATAVSNRVSRRQAERWSAQDQSTYQQQQYAQPQPQYVEAAPPPAVAAGGGEDDVIEKLTKLGALRDQGILSDAEFEAQKQRVLAGG